MPQRRWLSGLLVSVALVTAVTGLIAMLEPHVPGLLGLPSLYLLAVLPVALWWGVGFAAAVAVASSAVFAFVFLPPRFSFSVSDSRQLVSVGVFLVTAVVVGQLAARVTREARESTRLSTEQVALRRVATLVARRASPDEVFAVVIDEVSRLHGVDMTSLLRFEEGGRGSYLVRGSGWSEAIRADQLFEDLPGEDILKAGSTFRTDDISRVPELADLVSSDGLAATIGCPIVVEGQVWGALVVGSRSGPLPPETEQRLLHFTELIGMAIANAEGRAEVTRLLDQQATLRRVATLVARGVSPEEVFATATAEISRVLGADAALMVRLDSDGGTTVLGMLGDHPDVMTVGSRWEIEPAVAMAEVLRTGRPARRDDYSEIPGAFAAVIRQMGIQSSVAIPIVVAGRIWGALGVGTRRERFPADTEQRMASFTELVATAVANAENRAEIIRLLAEQAALRRVATLVAGGPSPAAVSTVVAEEVGRLLGADDTGVCRFEPDGTAVLVVGLGESLGQSPPGTRWELHDFLSTTTVWRTGRSARQDSDRWATAPGPVAAQLRQMGLRSVASSPIAVEGRLWGAVLVWSKAKPLPEDTEERLSNFTELVAMAIGNAESRAELAASRARVVAASDQTRRRIERDLHDGAQQRLVSLGLELRLAQGSVPPDLHEVHAGIGNVAEGLAGVLDDLREMSRGIHPAILSESGLGPAMRTLARRSTVPVELDVRTRGRFPEPIEVAAYYVVSEALANTAKHAGASYAEVCVEERDGALRLTVRDDGTGGADPSRGTGLTGLRDRVEALGGSIEVNSPAGVGTLIRAMLPGAAG